MEARYLTDESGQRIGVVLDVAEYERLRRSAEEAARTERHPGIAFCGAEGSRRAWVPGTALDVWEIVAAYREMGRKRVFEESGLSEDPLDAALAYHRAYHDEVDEKILENDRPLPYWRKRYPHLTIQTIEHRPETCAPALLQAPSRSRTDKSMSRIRRNWSATLRRYGKPVKDGIRRILQRLAAALNRRTLRLHESVLPQQASRSRGTKDEKGQAAYLFGVSFSSV